MIQQIDVNKEKWIFNGGETVAFYLLKGCKEFHYEVKVIKLKDWPVEEDKKALTKLGYKKTDLVVSLNPFSLSSKRENAFEEAMERINEKSTDFKPSNLMKTFVQAPAGVFATKERRIGGLTYFYDYSYEERFVLEQRMYKLRHYITNANIGAKVKEKEAVNATAFVKAVELPIFLKTLENFMLENAQTKTASSELEK